MPRSAARSATAVAIVDTAEAVARQTARRCEQLEAARRFAFDRSPSSAAVRLYSTGDAARLQRVAARWLPFAFETAPAPPLPAEA